MARRKSNKRKMFHKKIKEKENKIRRSRKGEKIEFSDSEIERIMIKYDIADYTLGTWGDIIVRTRFSNWKISVDPDEEVVFLHHENERLSRVGNYRSAYHIHNVFYDLDYCVKSIVEHDSYKESKIRGEKDDRWKSIKNNKRDNSS